MRASILTLLSLLCACSDYAIHGEDKENEEVDTGALIDTDTNEPDDTSEPEDTSEPDDDVCQDQDFDAETLTLREECYVEYTIGTFTPVVEWRKESWSVEPSSNNIMMAPAVASLTDDNSDGLINQDDIPDIIVITYPSYSPGTLRAVSGDGSGEIFNVTNPNLQGQGAVAVGDIDNDGIVEIVACTLDQRVMAFEHDGTLKWTSPSLSGHMYGISDAPAIADMDGDGSPEIIIGRAILTNTGSIRGVGSYGMGASSNVGTTSFAADIDGDGTQEVVTGNALYRPDGSAIWYNGQTDGYVAVANFDSDAEGEIVVMRDGVVRLQDSDGTVLWNATTGAAISGYGGPPTVADYDGDGLPEVGVAGRSTYSVIDTNGTILWERTTQDYSSGNTGSAVFDFEGDGVAEVVYADETRLWVFNGPDGTVKLESTDHFNYTWTEYPVIADVDADGHAEIVVPNTNGPYGFNVFGDADDSWREGRRIWNQHAYSITNVNDDGTIPTSPAQNWLSYNNFRSGDLTAGSGGIYPDLVVDIVHVCTFDCDEGRLEVWVQVGNQGYDDVVDGVELVLWGTTGAGGLIELARQDITDTILSGVLEASIQLTIDLDDLGGAQPVDLIATIDGGNDATDDFYDECDETNNEDSWGENLCP